MARRLWCFLPVLLLGCADDLERYSEVIGLRVLAMVADPPEVFFDEPPLLGTVTWSALVVDPTGGALEYAWRFCPVESAYACDDLDEKLALAEDYADTAALRALWEADRLEGSAGRVAASPMEPEPEPSRPFAVPDFVRTTDAAGIGSDGRFGDDLAPLEGYFQMTGFYGFGMGAWPTAVLEVSSGGETIVAQKRLTMGLADYAVANLVVEDALGYRFCASDETEADGCLPFNNRTPNQNPVFDALAWSEGDQADGEFEELADGAQLSVERGESIRIRPGFSEASFETYRVLKGDLESQEIFVTEATEEISVSWFLSGACDDPDACELGELQDELTWPKFTKTLDTVFTAPEKAPSGGIVTVWMVARDQRGGEAWRFVDVVID